MVNIDRKINWDSKITKKHAEEAKARNLTLLGSVGIKGDRATINLRNYRFNQCGHRQSIDIGKVRKNSFRCDKCQQQKIEQEAKKVDLTFISVGKKKKYNLYRFNNCGNELEIHTSSIRRAIQRGKTQFECPKCLEHKLEEEAKAAGLTLIGASKKSAYRKYRFNKCGHKREMLISNVRSKSFFCKDCWKKEIKEEAKAAGLTLIGAGKNVGKNLIRKYRFNDCKHYQNIEIGKVRSGSFICNTCDKIWKDLPSKLYILKIKVDNLEGSFTWLKLGYAKNINARIKKYGLPEDANIRRLKVINFETGRQAHRFESFCHTKYKEKRLPIKQMKDFHRKSGFAECYPMEMLDVLITEIEAKERRLKETS